jgi:plastocyanin
MPRFVYGIRVCASVFALLTAGPAAADFIYGDDFESSLTCSGGGPAIAGAMSPTSVNTQLGMQTRYLVKVLSCGFSGPVALTPSGTPASWGVVLDPPVLQVALNSAAVSELTVTVPTDGDAGSVMIHIDAAASGANTALLASSLNVANEYSIHFAPDGTGSGPHAFLPVYLQVKLGAKLRFIDDDSTDVHRIHGVGSSGFAHQAFDMSQGQEYDITPTATITNTPIYCHDHPGTGTMYVTVVP